MNFELIAITISTISVIIATVTFYLLHIKGPNITIKINKAIEIESGLSMTIPALFINDGGKPGFLLHDLEWEDIRVSPPKFLKDFGCHSKFIFDGVVFPAKIAPGESIMCTIIINFTDDFNKIKELDNLINMYREIEFKVEFFSTTKRGIKGKKEILKIRTKKKKTIYDLKKRYKFWLLII